MRKLILNLLFLLPGSLAFGTAQVPEILIYKGDTLSMFDCLLAYLPDQTIFTPQNLFGSSGCVYTGCYRNYVSTWIIEKDSLFLIRIRNACYPTDQKYVAASFRNEAKTPGKEYADLKKLFPGRYKNGRVFAYWVNRTVISPKGKLLFYLNDGYESVFEKEIEFTVGNGRLTQVKELDNRKTHQSEYTQNPELLKEFIQKNINYSNLKKTEGTVKVIVLVNGANDEGKIDSVRILKGYNEEYNREALRVIKSIPDWDVVYRHGQRARGYLWSVPVVFDWK